MKNPAALLREFERQVRELAAETSGKRIASDLAGELPGVIQSGDGMTPATLITELLPTNKQAAALDFGCGAGPHREMIEKAGYRWTGLNHQDFPFARDVEDVVLYDGGRIPADDEQFDLVWSSQSLEHVHHPELAFSEISRVLNSKGVFAGSVSFLEPYHGRSTVCYTPYGFHLYCKRNGMQLLRVYPKICGLSLMARYWFLMMGLENVEWTDLMKDGGMSFRALRNYEGISEQAVANSTAQICGHFFFVAQRTEAW